MSARQVPGWRGHLNRWLPLALLLLALAPALAKLPAATDFMAAILTYPFQVDDSEGVILSEAQWLARGVDPYQPARADFFTAAPYTPIFTLLNAAAFAVGPFTFKVGRGLALLATLIIAGELGVLLWHRSRNLLLSLWPALTLLTINLIDVWAVRARPDHLALAWNLAGVAIIYCRWQRPTGGTIPWGTLTLAALLCALGFFTKQTLLAAPLAIGAALLLTRPRQGLIFGGLFGALVLLPFAALTALTRGGFYQHIVAFHSSWSWQGFWRLAGPFLARYWPLLLIAASLPALLLLARRPRDDRDLLPALYLPIAAAFSLGAGTHGGNHNHFVETLVVAVWCVALLGARLARGSRPALAALPLLVVALTLGYESRLATPNWLARDFRTPRAAEREGWANVAAFVTNDSGPVYSDNVGLLLVAGKEVRYTDPFSLAYATRTGQWDDRALVERVARGEFSLIALRYNIEIATGAPDDLTDGLYTAIRARYQLIEQNVMYLYVRR